MLKATLPLFNERVLSRELAQFVASDGLPSKVAVEQVQQWHSRSKRGLFKTYSETQLEQSFLQMLFVQILGYSTIGHGPTHTLSPKRTARTGRDVPDFVLGIFTPGARIEKWVAVGEIKSLNTPLDTPQSRPPYETPVEQAFRYAMHGQPGVEWVLVTNLSEIRLYRNGYLDAYKSWTFDELSDAKRLAELCLILRQANFIAERGISPTRALLDRSLKAGLELTEGFYGLYSIARHALIARMVESPVFAKAELAHVYGKAHKILNRALFVAYCEDHPAALLPDDTLIQTQRSAEKKKGKSRHWNAFQQLFRELDKGSPPGSPLAYNAFNGGLFAPDAEIDGLRLPDELFTESFFYDQRGRQSREMTGIFGFHVYDFTNELNVDALGAIFEQSLKDIAVEGASVRGHGTIAITTRETHGVYYTAKEITRFMVTRAFDAFMQPIRESAEKDAAEEPIKKPSRSKKKRPLTITETRQKLFFQEVLEQLRRTRLQDPACGSGAFLIEALRHFSEQYSSVNAALSRILRTKPLFGLDRFVLRNNLFGWDILAESTELAKLSIWLRTASSNEPLEDLRQTIAVHDSLRTADQDRFDIIVSNPPWGASLEGWTDSEVRTRFPECGEEKDSYAIFLMRAHELLHEGGVVAFIMPNSWLTTIGYESFRRWVLSSFEILELVNVWKIFTDVNHDACIAVLKKREAANDAPSAPKRYAQVRCIETGGTAADKCLRLAEEKWKFDFEAKSDQWANEPLARFETMYEPRLAQELDRVAARCPTLGECCEITVGIQVYHRRKVSQDVISRRAFHSKTKAGADWFRFITGNEVQRYFEVPSETAFLKYSDELCDKRELKHYALPRVLVQQIFWNRIAAAMSSPTEPSLYLNTLFSLTLPKKGYSLEYLLAVLNSRIVSACYERWANRLFGDKFPKLSKVDLARIPVPRPSAEAHRRLKKLGRELGEQWAALKAEIRTYHDYLSVADGSGKLKRSLESPWTVNREEFVQTVGTTGVKLSANEIGSLVDRWKRAVKQVHGVWSKICEREEKVDEAVARAYGIRKALYQELRERAPVCSLDDALLPR